MNWRYKAFNRMAREVAGIEAGARKEVLARLKSRGLAVISLYPDFYGWAVSLMTKKQVSSKQLSLFFQDFANMLSAGISLKNSFFALEETSCCSELALVCRNAVGDIESGKGLAEAFSSSSVFPKISLTALSAGERSGNIPQVMELLSKHYKVLADIRRRMLGSLGYPAVVFCVLTGAVVYASVAVIPQLEPLLPRGAMEGGLTRILVGFSHVLQTEWPLVLGGLALLAGGAVFWAKKDPTFFAGLASHFPFIGPAQKDLELSMIFFNLYVLQKSGIPLEMALQETLAGVGVEAGAHLEECRRFLAGGLTLSEALGRDEYFPRIVADTVRIGEETGRYDEYFERVFHHFYRSFQTRMDVLSSALHPALLCVSAVLIASFALGFLKPIYANLTNVGVLR
ncbi:MAG: type II secretion system F family protein [Candidatus Omnitrophica bacterium]|nr:type II secretion system F family protein [Candidatus Omnitrophota bacterium]